MIGGFHRYRRTPSSELPARLVRVRELLGAGHTLRSAAAVLGVSHETVRKLAQRAGVPMRPRGRPAGDRTVNTPALAVQ